MNVIVRNQAKNHLFNAMEQVPMPNNTKVGFFFNDLENNYLAFNTNWDVESFDTITECLKFIKT